MTPKAAQKPQLLVFTDLDGSLLEHESYSIDPALPSVRLLQEREFMLVMNSSKTAAEIRALQARLSLRAPFVSENGAVLHLLEPDTEGRQDIVFGKPRADWLPTLHEIRETESFDFEGFADWSSREIGEMTGLAPEAAELAKQREYSEPILWRGASGRLTKFNKLLEKMDLQALEGGRFLSIQGRHDKSDAMRWLKTRKRQSRNEPPELITVALGDSPNDSAMLNAADIAVIIKSGKSDRIRLNLPGRIIRTKRPGPSGWHDAISEILQLLDSDKLKPQERTY